MLAERLLASVVAQKFLKGFGVPEEQLLAERVFRKQVTNVSNRSDRSSVRDGTQGPLGLRSMDSCCFPSCRNQFPSADQVSRFEA